MYNYTSTPTPTSNSSRSPRSPRSPSGITNAVRTPQSPIHSHSPSEPPIETSSQLIGGANRPLYSVDDVSAHPRYNHLRQDIANRPKTSSGQQPSTARQQQQPPSQQKRGVDHSRSASRFWGFGKSSKAANQFRHAHANSSNEGMSRGPGYPPAPDKVLTKKNKSTGMYLLYHHGHAIIQRFLLD